MNPFSRKMFLKAALLTILPGTALAEPIQEWRCSTDSLDITQALARIEWARRCGLSSNTTGPANFFASNKSLDKVTFDWAREYKEGNLHKAYTGNLNDYNINYYYVFARYDSQTLVTQSQQTTAPLTGFWTWASTTQRPRPLYPSFENTTVAGSGTQLFPSGNPSDCSLYTRSSTGSLVKWTNNSYVIAYCEASCYAPDQNLLFSDGEANIVEAMESGREDLMTLSPDATLDNLSLRKNTVYSYTSETRDGEHVIYEISTAMGGKLRVTNEHPVITSEGRLVKAESLKEGDELLKADGTPDRIVSVEKTTHFGKVYNIKPVSRDPVSNILVAQGFLVGSARFQNDDVEYMNRVLLYRAVPEEVMPQ